MERRVLDRSHRLNPSWAEGHPAETNRMKADVRAQCLMHLRAAAVCLGQADYSVLEVRVLDVVDEIEQDLVPSDAIPVPERDS